MSYNVSTGLIHAPVTIQDLQNCFNVAITVDGDQAISSDLGMNIYAESGQTYTIDGKQVHVDTRRNINKWSKYKPVRNHTMFTNSPTSFDDATGQWIDQPNQLNWWQVEGKCGLDIEAFSTFGSFTTPGTFLYKLKHNLLPWAYLKPRGGDNEPFRMTDFNCYGHLATPPLVELGNAGGDIPAEETTDGKRSFTLTFETSTDDGQSLKFQHFKISGEWLSNYYLGVVLYRSDNDYRIVTSTQEIGQEDGSTIECVVGNDDIGEWHVFPFISDRIIAIDGEMQDGVYLSAGYENSLNKNSEKVNIRPTGTYLAIDTSAVWTNPENNKIAFNVRVKNEKSAPVTFHGGIYVSLKTRTHNQSYAEGTEILNWTYHNDVIVPANDSVSLPATATTYTYGGETAEFDTCAEFSNITYDQSLVYYMTATPVDSGIIITNQYNEIDNLFAKL